MLIRDMKQTPDWLDHEIINEPIDNETKKEYEDFKLFLEGFRNEEFNKKNKNEI